MEAVDVVTVARTALWVIAVITGPMLAVALILGVAIGLVQALTQVQEMTLTFVPKLIGIGLALLLSLPLIGDAMAGLTRELADRIAAPVAGVLPPRDGGKAP